MICKDVECMTFNEIPEVLDRSIYGEMLTVKGTVTRFSRGELPLEI